MSVAEKKRCIEPGHPGLSIRRQCELIGLSRSSYYRESGEGLESAENLELMRLIDEEYTRHPFYGTRQMRNWLRRQGYKVNRKRIQRLMRKMGLQSIAPKPNTSKAAPEHKVYPYLIGGIDVDRADQVWCSDITYIRMEGGFAYLTAVMDWHSRFVLSWEICVCMDAEFCVSALERALRRHGRPEIFNTDQGAQFTCGDFVGTLENNEIKISMDGKGRAMDNIFIERLWRSVKYEEVYLKEYRSVKQLRKAMDEYFDFYNNERPHQSFDGRTPAEIYFGGAKMARAA
jgi:putative transposase